MKLAYSDLLFYVRCAFVLYSGNSALSSDTTQYWFRTSTPPTSHTPPTHYTTTHPPTTIKSRVSLRPRLDLHVQVAGDCENQVWQRHHRRHPEVHAVHPVEPHRRVTGHLRNVHGRRRSGHLCVHALQIPEPGPRWQNAGWK